MPEIWLNYGITDVVLDIRAENLEQKIDSEGKILEDSAINEKLNTLDLSKPMELVVLHNSKSIQKIISSLFTLCEQKSKPFPKILADKKILKFSSKQDYLKEVQLTNLMMLIFQIPILCLWLKWNLMDYLVMKPFLLV